MTPVMIANSLKVVEPRLLPSLSAGLDAGFVGRMVELGSADGVGERDEAPTEHCLLFLLPPLSPLDRSIQQAELGLCFLAAWYGLATDRSIDHVVLAMY